MRFGNGSCLILWFLGLRMGLFCCLGCPLSLCVLTGTNRDKCDSRLPQPWRGRGERGVCREVHVFHRSGVPSCDDHCQSEDKAACLACGEEGKSQERRDFDHPSIMYFCTGFLCFIALSACLGWWGRATWGEAELWGSGDYLGILLWLVPLAVCFLA